jgi:uncharacterized protein
MVRERLVRYQGEIRRELEAAFDERSSPHAVAGSFALGVFITSLPTLGTGFVVFAALLLLVDRVNKAALLASVVVLNPVVKWGVYAASFWLGTLLLGPVPGLTPAEIELSFSAGPEIVHRLLLGNLILAVVFTLVGYWVVLRLVVEYRTKEIDVEEMLPEIPSD